MWRKKEKKRKNEFVYTQLQHARRLRKLAAIRLVLKFGSSALRTCRQILPRVGKNRGKFGGNSSRLQTTQAISASNIPLWTKITHFCPNNGLSSKGSDSAKKKKKNNGNLHKPTSTMVGVVYLSKYDRRGVPSPRSTWGLAYPGHLSCVF